ncbi:MAG: aspartate/glutamate racemase family protein, partial [Bacteroidales bacterium]|nr:aspartate/glutamate racemase family protein [Bacteroidales bacterium]
LVELIESGRIDSAATRELLSKYLLPMVEQGIDQLVLGCTHYPFLIPVIREIIPSGIKIIDPAPAVARHTREVLEENDGLNQSGEVPNYQFYTTGSIENIQKMLKGLTGIDQIVSHIADLS